ncbi:hypothetical protein C8F04DRAFT_1255131 [Mycena alexandri]|uniref:Uncharacterized protein n=1 Tax=Mycena alexandri TaxID=1745969 RepID=A0AAD6X7E9_9AGAR|nr:hypothetical protein C8F04DRAFT_1255131 [Mycena alexandri]
MTPLNTTALKGSSRTRPWVFNGRDELVLSDAANLHGRRQSTMGLTGSSRTRPWVFDGRDGLVLSDAANIERHRQSTTKTETLEASLKRASSRDAIPDERKPSLVVPAGDVAKVAAPVAGGAVDDAAVGQAGAATAGTRKATDDDGLTWIEQHGAALAWPLKRAALLRKARERSNMMRAGAAPYPRRHRSPAAENDENVALRGEYQFRPRHSRNRS